MFQTESVVPEKAEERIDQSGFRNMVLAEAFPAEPDNRPIILPSAGTKFTVTQGEVVDPPNSRSSSSARSRTRQDPTGKEHENMLSITNHVLQ
jgi:hypothetical protein